MSNGLNALRDEALRIAHEHGFNENTVGEEIALMHSELSEALVRARRSATTLEDVRRSLPPDELHFRTPNGRVYETLDAGRAAGNLDRDLKPCGVPSEMADVIIRVLHFCGKHGIDIEHAVELKMAYNETRPHKHGGKVL